MAEGITKQTKISVEILIVLIVLTASIVGSLIRAEMNNSAAKKDIAELRGQFTAYANTTTLELKTMNSTLNEMLIQSRIKNQLDAVRMGDRWTAGMEEDRWDEVRRVFRILHPNEELPAMSTVEQIQRKHLNRMYKELDTVH